MKEKLSITLDRKTVAKVDGIIDNLVIRNRSQAIEYLIDNAIGDNKKAVILAGGPEHMQAFGQGDYRVTAPIGKSTLIELALKKLRESGFTDIFVVAPHKVLTRIFDLVRDGEPYDVRITYVEENTPRGTAHSLKLVKGRISENFLVVYGVLVFQNINLDELWNQHLRSNSMATLMLTTSAKPSEKGTVVMEGSRVLSFVQKPKKSDIYLVFSPIFAAKPELLQQDGDSLEYDIFPRLAVKGLLGGHLSSEKEIHIYRREDIKLVRA